MFSLTICLQSMHGVAVRLAASSADLFASPKIVYMLFFRGILCNAPLFQRQYPTEIAQVECSMIIYTYLHPRYTINSSSALLALGRKFWTRPPANIL